MTTTLTDDEIADRMTRVPGWTRDGRTIRRQYTFADFPAAVAFVSRLVEPCEADDHHPDITINYRRVTLSYTTHDAGGLTIKDFDGAAAADRLA